MHGNLEPEENVFSQQSIDVPLEDMTYILVQLWKCRKSEKKCEEMYEKYKALIPKE